MNIIYAILGFVYDESPLLESGILIDPRCYSNWSMH